MHVTLVYVEVKAEQVEAFITATGANHAASVREPGNLRFDVLQSSTDVTRFVLYEAYRSAEEAAAHKQTAHYLSWRDTVADWMAEPRRGDSYHGIFPGLPDRQA